MENAQILDAERDGSDDSDDHGQETPFPPSHAARLLFARSLGGHALPALGVGHAVGLVDARHGGPHVEEVDEHEVGGLRVDGGAVCDGGAQRAQPRLGVRDADVGVVGRLDAEQRGAVQEVVHEEHAAGAGGLLGRG